MNVFLYVTLLNVCKIIKEMNVFWSIDVFWEHNFVKTTNLYCTSFIFLSLCRKIMVIFVSNLGVRTADTTVATKL